MSDLMNDVIAGIESRDHRKTLVCDDTIDAVFDQMEADGYVFCCARKADQFGMRTAYFVPKDPEPGYRM
jgi:hypothetical protein